MAPRARGGRRDSWGNPPEALLPPVAPGRRGGFLEQPIESLHYLQARRIEALLGEMLVRAFQALLNFLHALQRGQARAGGAVVGIELAGALEAIAGLVVLIAAHQRQ